MDYPDLLTDQSFSLQQIARIAWRHIKRNWILYLIVDAVLFAMDELFALKMEQMTSMAVPQMSLPNIVLLFITTLLSLYQTSLIMTTIIYEIQNYSDSLQFTAALVKLSVLIKAVLFTALLLAGTILPFLLLMGVVSTSAITQGGGLPIIALIIGIAGLIVTVVVALHAFFVSDSLFFMVKKTAREALKHSIILFRSNWKRVLKVIAIVMLPPLVPAVYILFQGMNPVMLVLVNAFSSLYAIFGICFSVGFYISIDKMKVKAVLDTLKPDTPEQSPPD